MTDIEEIARLEFGAADPAVSPISVAKWRERAQDEFNNYHFLVMILNMDSTELVLDVPKHTRPAQGSCRFIACES